MRLGDLAGACLQAEEESAWSRAWKPKPGMEDCSLDARTSCRKTSRV